MEVQQAKYLLMGINLNVFAVVLALTSSGVVTFSLLFGIAGLVVAALGWARPSSIAPSNETSAST
jgi:hypothetical protein